MKRITKYFQVSTPQLLLMACLTGVVSAGIVIINIRLNEYQQLPEVHFNSTGSCVSVSNYRNGDAYQCGDVDVILRNYRVKNETNDNPTRSATDIPDPSVLDLQTDAKSAGR